MKKRILIRCFIMAFILSMLFGMHICVSANDECVNICLIKGAASAVNAVYKTNSEITSNGACLSGTNDGKAELLITMEKNIFENYENAVISFEYFDYGWGWFIFEYTDANGNLKTSEPVCMTNTKTDVKKEFTLFDASFASNADLKLTSYTGENDYEHSEYPVFIKNISIKPDGTYNFVSIDVKSGNAGNIFYSDEEINFDISLASRLPAAAEITLRYKAFILDENMERHEVFSDLRNYCLEENGKTTDSLCFDVEKYGLYILCISASGEWDEKSVNYILDREFSKCVKSAGLNKTFGAAAHISAGRGEAETAFLLMKNAGMGVIREAIHWSTYEKTQNSKFLADSIKKSFTVSDRLGLDRILTLMTRNPAIDLKIGGNSRYALASDDKSVQKALYDYVYRFLQEPESKNIKMLEIENEPDTVKYLNGRNIENENIRYVDIGISYANSAITMCRAAKDAKPDIKVGIFALGGFLDEKSKIIADTALFVLKKANAYNLFNAVTFHPYMGTGEDPEYGTDGSGSSFDDYSSAVGRIKYFDDLLCSRTSGIYTGDYYNAGISQKWYTEYGYSSATRKPDINTAESEYDAAVKSIRQYLYMKEYGFNDIYCVYNLIDSNHIENARESNFGMLKYHRDIDVPYAAKFSYLAVANLNNLLFDTSECEAAAKVDCRFVYRFSNAEKDVYALWTSKKNSGEKCQISLGTEAEYYDFFGNKLSEEDVTDISGNYVLTQTPFYAVVKK